jgi:hypothetical protein
MLINEHMLGAAALISLFNAVRGQGTKSLVAPKGAEVLTVGVIGGIINVLSGAMSIVTLLTNVQTMAGPDGSRRQIISASRSFLSS